MKDENPPVASIRKKVLVALSVVLTAVILVISGMMLVHNAQIRQTPVPAPVTKGTKSGLTVNTSNESVLSATSNNEAGSELQGASTDGSSAVNSTENNSQDNPLAVGPSQSTSKKSCDDSKKSDIMNVYNRGVSTENKYHDGLVKYLNGEVLGLSAEMTRHDSVLTKLSSTLTSSLSAIGCTK